MSFVPFTLLDYTLCYGGPFPLVTQSYYYSPDYSAKVTDRGADAFLDGAHIASFDTMEEACKFIAEQSKRRSPWFAP